MWKNIFNAWANNHGWLLSGTGLIAACVACTIWYLELVPLVFLGSSDNKALVSQTVQSQNGILVAQIQASAERKNSKGKILLYIPDDEQNAFPVYQERFTLDERGAASLLLVVPAREYSMIAFIDTNDNGQIDFEDDRAKEDFRMPHTFTVSGASASPTSRGIVALPAQTPCLCVFDFTTSSVP
ncbi:MAG: hypothetical protein U0930_23770 [Pirellulales bacterium]